MKPVTTRHWLNAIAELFLGRSDRVNMDFQPVQGVCDQQTNTYQAWYDSFL